MPTLVASDVTTNQATTSYVRPAVVTSAVEAGRCRVRLELDGRAIELPAVVAIARAPALDAGACVLVTGEGLEGCYVIGVLGDEAGPASERRVSTRSGASAEVKIDGEKERIEVRDPEGHLVLAYEPDTGRSVLSAPSGSLALHAPEGDIELVSGGAVRCRGAGGVTLEAGAASSPARPQERRPSLALGKEGARLAARTLTIAGERADLLLADARYHGVRLSATVEQAKVVMERLESAAVQVVSRAKRFFRHAEDLDQLTAGRSRTVVEGAYTVQGGHASIQAKDEVKIDGKRVYLG